MPGTRLGPETCPGPGGWEVLSLAEALADRAWQLDFTDTDDDGFVRWQPSWIPVVAWDADNLYVDCDTGTVHHCSPSSEGMTVVLRPSDRLAR